MSVVNSPNMSLPVPVVGVEPGPDYASDINNCMSVIDNHTHTPGSGVLITPAAMDINTDLTFSNSRLTSAKSVTFTSQGSPLPAASPDTLAIYASGADLYYNDGNGNQIRITQSGGVVGTPGSITGLVAPASASYVTADSTFVWQSDVNTPANTDTAAIILRNLVANSKGLTLSPPVAMASDYSLVLPPLPMANSFMQLDTSGNITASIPLSKGLTHSNLSDTAGIVVGQLDLTGASQIITTSGSYSVPSNVDSLFIIGAAGGGGGAGGANGGGGGGGGGGSRVFNGRITVVPGETLTITIGAGGAGGAAGLSSPSSNGGDGTATTIVGSTSGSLLSIYPGLGGTYGTAGGPGAGGAGGTGGGNGDPGIAGNGDVSAGAGGASFFNGRSGSNSGGTGGTGSGGGGGGGGGSYGAGGSGGTPGSAASANTGAGGGGGNGTNRTGGAGGSGILIISKI